MRPDLFVLDTDTLQHFQNGNPLVVNRIQQIAPERRAITVVTVEEQISGWYAQLRQAKNHAKLAWAYGRLSANVRFLSRVEIIDFDEPAIRCYEALKQQKIKVRKMDLRIAAIVLVHQATLVTCNVHDFRKVSNLRIVDWSK